MPEIKACKRCGSLFKSDVRIFCPTCRKIEEEEFRRVREYLRLNRDASLMEIVIATGVDQKKILDYIRRGRIEVQKEDFGVIIKCEICSAPVSSGMLCLKCYQKLTQPSKETAEEDPEAAAETIRNKLIRRKRTEDLDHVYFRREEITKKESEDGSENK